jgi:hypothetical protein
MTTTIPSTLPRRFSLKALVILGVLQFLGNMASIPLLHESGANSEPLPCQILYTALSFIIIGLGLYWASQAGLGAPLLEGRLGSKQRPRWLLKVTLCSALGAIAASLPFLLLNLNAQPIPPSMLWKFVLGSLDAGIQEENFYRLFLMSFIVWFASIRSRKRGVSPSKTLYWSAIIISGLLFGWAHIDEQLADPGSGATAFALFDTMILISILGVIFGWLYWKLGLESAILAHFLADALGSTVVVPVYLSDSPTVQALTLIAFLIAGLLLGRLLVRSNPEVPPHADS